MIHAANKDGQFSLTDLAPGHYSAIATPRVDPHFWDTPAFVREMYERGTQFDLSEGEQKKLTVTQLSDTDLTQLAIQSGVY